MSRSQVGDPSRSRRAPAPRLHHRTLVALVAVIVMVATGLKLCLGSPFSEESSSESFSYSWPDTFACFCYTPSEMMLFSYYDETELEVVGPADTIVWSGVLGEEQYETLTPGSGFYEVRGNKQYSVLVGDPSANRISGYYAVDEGSRPLSTRILTYMPSSIYGFELFIVFAYQDSTDASIVDLITGVVVWSGLLNAGEHHSLVMSGVPIKVESDKPVSALSYGDIGYYVPAACGTLCGTLFYTYTGAAQWEPDLNIIAFEDATSVDVTFTETGVPVWSGELNRAQHHSVINIEDEEYITVESNKPITVCMSPSPDSTHPVFCHFMRVADSTGHGVGTLFYVPACASRLYIVSWSDAAHVHVVNQSTGFTEWSGVLNRAQTKVHSAGKAFYEIRSTAPIAVFEALCEAWGADFATVIRLYSTHVDPAGPPQKTGPTLCQNSPNPFSTVTVILYALADDSWVSLEVYNVSGRLVETLVNERQEPGIYQVRWDRRDNPSGIHFYRLQAGDFTDVKKMIVLR